MARTNTPWFALRWMLLGALVPGLVAAVAQKPADPAPDDSTPTAADPQTHPTLPTISSVRRTPVVRAVEAVRPAIVSIEVLESGQRYESAGSGVLVNARGFVLTNYHVVRGAKAVQVRFASGEVSQTSLEALSESSDLALLALADRRNDHPYVRLGSSEDLLAGETVIAIGNPFGFQHTVSTGVVSAVRRRLRLPAGGSYGDFIQTDAAINPGNSGGALVNLDGELIGVNSAIFGQGWGLAFAIPIDRIKQLLAEYVRREYSLGIEVDADAHGLVVRDVLPDGAAIVAGIAPGDRLLFGNGQPLLDPVDLVLASLGATPRQPLRLHVKREARELAFDVGGIPLLWSRLGLRGRDLIPTADATLRGGVRIERLDEAGPAATAGLEVGDVIHRVTVHRDGRTQECRLRSSDDLVVVVERWESDAELTFVLYREGRQVEVRLRPGD